MADEARSRLGRGLASLIGDVGGEAAHVDRPRAQRKVPIDMRGLAADISDQTCKTATQSRTRFVGHRQLP